MSESPGTPSPSGDGSRPGEPSAEASGEPAEGAERAPGWRAARKEPPAARFWNGPVSDTLWIGAVSAVLVTALVLATVFVITSDTGEEAADRPDSGRLGVAAARVADPVVLHPKDEKRVARAPKLKKVDKRAARLAKRAERMQLAATEPFSVRIASFNILGTQHTAPGGKKPASWPSSAARLPGAVAAIKAHKVSAVGLQEVQPDQMAGLLRGTGFEVYPGPDVDALNRVNPIMWDPAVFEFVSGSTFQMTNGRGTRAQPIVRLRHRATGREFFMVNSHPPAGRNGSMAAKRMGAFNQLVGVVNSLKAQGLPIVLTGDMNDRAAFFCRVVAPAGLVASVGGSTSGGCRPPAQMPVDWVVATPDVTFSNYVRDTSVPARRISDHYLISATATFSAAD